MHVPIFPRWLPISVLALGLTAIVGCGGHDGRSRQGGSAAPAASASVATVRSLSPSEGPEVGANTLTIETAGFSRPFQAGVDQVTLGGVALTSVSTPNSTTIVGVAPAGSGSVDVIVSQGSEVASLSAGYTYRAAEVVSITPPTGAAGDRVLVEGAFFAQDFSARVPSITFGGAAATQVTPLSASVLMVTVPAGAGTVDVRIDATVPTQSATSSGAWTYGAGGSGALEARVETGPASPGMLRAPAPTAGIVLAQVRVSSTLAGTLQTFSITPDGTIDESLGLGDVVLYLDSNADGVRDPGEPQLGTGAAFQANGSPLDFTGLNASVTPTSPLDVLVVSELRSAATIGDVVAFRVEGHRLQFATSAGPLPVRGAATSGSLQVVGNDPPKTVEVAPSPAAPASGPLTADAADVTVLALRFTSLTGQIDLHRLSYRVSGTADDRQDVLEATLALDRNSDGQLDANDTVIGRGRPDRDDGLLTFAFGGQRLSTGTSRFDVLLAYTLTGTAAPGETFQATLSESGVYAHAYYGDGGQQVTVANGSITHAPLTVTSAAAALRAQSNNEPASVTPGGAESLALRLDLEAGQSQVDLSALTVHATGTLNDALAVTAVSLYADTNSDGVFSAGVDQRLAGPLTFSSDDGQVTLSPSSPVVVAARSSTLLLVTVTLASGLAPGQTVSLAVTPAADVTATTSASGTTQHGTLLISGSGTSEVIQPDPELGKDAYLRGEGLYLNDNFGYTNGLAVGDRDFGQLGERLSYIEFPLPTVPAGRTVTRAYVALFVASTANLAGNHVDVQVFRVVPSGNRTPWVEGRGGLDASMDGIVFDGSSQATTRTDTTHPDVAPTPVTELAVTSGMQGRWVVLDVTAAAQAWYGGSPNYGLRLRDKDFTRHDDGWVTFWSSDVAWASLRPTLIVEHR